MHCDCRGLASCKLRHYAALYGADPRRYDASRRPFEKDWQHGDVVFESGKCIDCGLCVQIAAAAGEPLGLTFIGRGFDVRVAAPFGAFAGRGPAKGRRRVRRRLSHRGAGDEEAGPVSCSGERL